jgi:hypothetical protein
MSADDVKTHFGIEDGVGIAAESQERLGELLRKIRSGSGSKEKYKRAVLMAVQKADEKFPKAQRLFVDLGAGVSDEKINQIATLTNGADQGLHGEAQMIYRTEMLSRLQNWNLERRVVSAPVMSKILERSFAQIVSASARSVSESLTEAMRAVQQEDMLSDYHKIFGHKYKRGKIAQNMEKNGEDDVKIKNGIMKLGGVQYRIEEIEVLAGAAMTKIVDTEYAQEFVLQNVIDMKDGLIFARMKNGCGGNFFACKATRLFPKTKDDVDASFSPPPSAPKSNPVSPSPPSASTAPTVVASPKYYSQMDRVEFDQNVRRIPRAHLISDELYSAFDKTNFNPGPDALRVFLAMAKRESDFQWDPRIERAKKDQIKNELLFFMDSAIDGKEKIGELSHQQQTKIKNYFMGQHPEMNEEEVTDLIEERMKMASWGYGYAMDTITNFTNTAPLQMEFKKLRNDLRILHANRNATEYDFYEWTQRLQTLWVKVRDKNGTIDLLTGNSISGMVKKLEHTPSSFGLWQINVDRFMKTIRKNGAINRFSQLVNLSEKKLRDELVKALSGKSSKLTKEQTISLITEGFLKPRFENHSQGENDDVKYMAVENMAGEMSTYRAAIQEKLNKILSPSPSLVLDGDLAILDPYTFDVDWNATSATGKTYQALGDYIDQNARDLTSSKQQIIKELCEADSWQKLASSDLYKRIMGNDLGKRIIPQVQSKLYAQKASSYWEKIKKFI